MANVIRRAHVCELGFVDDFSYGDIVQCGECARCWIVKFGWGGNTWRPLGFVKRWRLRRQIALEGGRP